jgi:cell division septum initiation protein DivIVA
VTDESTGLNLFDDTASAVGNFPTALRGYDRTAVDDYVRSLEVRVVQANRAARDLTEQVDQLQSRVTNATAGGGEVDFAKLGGRAKDILALAEEQARDVVKKANVDAQRLKEEARREADATREAAEKVGTGAVTDASEELERLRARGQENVQSQVERAKADAAAIVDAAHREADSIRREADHVAETTRQTAYLDGEEHRRAAESEAAQVRQAVAAERENALAQLRQQHTESVQATGALLAEATSHHQQAGERMTADIEAAAGIRAEAEAEAEAIIVRATQQAETREAAAQKRADAIAERTHREFAWRKDQLRQETELLTQRKKAVLGQLAALSDLANQSVAEFPDLQPLAEISDELDEFEDADKTTLRDGQLDDASTIVEDAAKAVDVDSVDEPASQGEGAAGAGSTTGSTSSNGAESSESDATVIAPAGESRSAKG